MRYDPVATKEHMNQAGKLQFVKSHRTTEHFQTKLRYDADKISEPGRGVYLG